MAENAIIKAILTLDDKQFTTAIERAQGKLRTFGQRMTRAGRDMTIGLSVPLIAIGRAIVNVSSDFDLVQRKIGALGSTGKLEGLVNSARELGATTIFTATQVGELQLILRKLGKEERTIKSLQGTILKFALAMDQDLATSGEFVVKTMNRFTESLSQFGDEAQQAAKVTEIFAVVAANTAVDSNRLANAMKYVGAEAAQYGLTLEQTTALLGVLGDKGFDASRGGTALRRVLAQLAKDGFTADEAIDKLLDSSGSFTEQLEQFGLRGAGSASALAGLREEYTALLAKLENSNGFLDQFSDAIDDSLFASLRKVTSATQELALAFGDTLIPVLQPVVEGFASMIRSLSKMPDMFKLFITGLGSVLAVLGPVTFALGVFSTAATQILGILKNAGKAVLKFGGLLRGLGVVMKANPYTAVISTIVTLALAFVDLKGDAEDATKAIDDQGDALKDLKTAADAYAAAGTTAGSDNKFFREATIKNIEEGKQAIEDLSKTIFATNNLGFFDSRKSELPELEEELASLFRFVKGEEQTLAALNKALQFEVDDAAKRRLDELLNRLKKGKEDLEAVAELFSIKKLTEQYIKLNAERSKIIVSANNNGLFDADRLKEVNSELKKTAGILREVGVNADKLKPKTEGDVNVPVGFLAPTLDIPGGLEEAQKVNAELRSLLAKGLSIEEQASVDKSITDGFLTTYVTGVSEAIRKTKALEKAGFKVLKMYQTPNKSQKAFDSLDPLDSASVREGNFTRDDFTSDELNTYLDTILLNEPLTFAIDLAIDETGQYVKIIDELSAAGEIATFTFAVLGDTIGNAMSQAIEGTSTFAEALSKNLKSALASILGQVVSLTFAYLGLALAKALFDGGTSAASGAAKLGSLSAFIGANMGLGSGTRSSAVLSGNDLAISTRRGVTANSRIYG